MNSSEKRIWTIGHSTRAWSDFIDILKSFQIRHLVDVRAFPGSRRYPHFNKENLSESLAHDNILYTHLVKLGGRRKPEPASVNTAWRNTSFRGYADYMQTPAFSEAINELESLALRNYVA